MSSDKPKQPILHWAQGNTCGDCVFYAKCGCNEETCESPPSCYLNPEIVIGRWPLDQACQFFTKRVIDEQ